jgi:hypothetical protein
MKRFLFHGLLFVAGVAAACSSSGGKTTATTSSSAGGASSASSGSSASSAASSGSGGSGGATGASSSSSSSGAGGMCACPTCVVLATPGAGSKPYGIAVDSANVYWTNYGTGQVMQAKTDGTSPVTLTTGETAPVAVRVYAGNVYWLSYSITSVLRTAPVGGGAVTDLTPAPAARDLVVGAATLWWTREPDDVQSIPLSGLPDGGTPALLSGNMLTNGITADATYVYFVDRSDGLINKADQGLSKATPLGSGDVPWDIAVDATNVYWTEMGSAANIGKVMQASNVDGSNAVPLATLQGSPQGIAIDGSDVYWANQSAGTINKVPIGGGTVTVLAQCQQQPEDVAVDATSVYWTNSGGGSVVKVAK